MSSRSQWLGLGTAVWLALCAAPAIAEPFTIAVIPDTQNYVDYRQQKSHGFPIDSRDLLMEQMRFVAAHAKSRGGDIVFSIGLGDMWQDRSVEMDPEHKARGFRGIPYTSSIFAALGETFRYYRTPTPETRGFEIPSVVKGYEQLDGVLPFSVVPGNHDYDSVWTDARFPPDPAKGGSYLWGMTHYTGLDNYRSEFSDKSKFFAGKSWYVDSHDGGVDSAQVFEAGGYKFLQIGLEFDPPDDALAWAQGVIDRHRGLPTIISMHNYLSTTNKRAFDVYHDPERNQPNATWNKLIRRNDQIFLVLSGHICGQGFGVDRTDGGGAVYQILSDFQCRRQVLKEAGSKNDAGLGDGWLRLMQFMLDGDKPSIHVRTYSTFYKAFSTDIPKYASWYKAEERPTYTDEEFLAEDDFRIELSDFRARFGPPNLPAN